MAEHNVNTVKAQIQSLINKANETTGNNDTNLTDGVNALVGGFKPSGTLEGLSNGYDVMFYDENNEGLAFYSIKSGHSINPPVYDCNGWKDADDNVVEFPYTPIGDLSLYADLTKIVLPSPYKAYAIYAQYSSGDWYIIALTDVEGFRLLGSNNQLYGIYGATKTIFKECSTMEEAVTELINVSNTGDISGFNTTKGYAYMSESACKNRPYYCSHYVCDWSSSTYLILETNPYEG